MISVLDIIVICVLALFAIIGFIKGFLNTLLSLFGNLASLAVAIVIVNPCKNFINNIFHIVDWLGGLIINGISSILPTVTSSMTGAEIVSYLNTNGGLLGKLTAMFVDSSATYETTEALSAALSASMGNFAATIFTVIVMFILIRIGVLILSKIFDAITKKRALSGLDRLLGLIFGAIKGSVLIVAVLSIFYALSPLIPQISDWITQSTFTNWLYTYVIQLINWIINSVDWSKLAVIGG